MGPWLPSEVPDPGRDFAACGNAGPATLCDPDGYLTESGRMDVLQALATIRAETSVVCPDGLEHGYQAAVLIIKRMHPLVWLGGDLEATARKFATEVGTTWGIGDAGCDNGVLLLLTVGDRYAYIKTTALSRRLLTDFRAQLIIKNMRWPLRLERYDEAVLQASVQTLDALTGRWVKGEKTATVLRVMLRLFQFGVILPIALLACPVPCIRVATVSVLFGLVMLVVMPLAMLADCCVALGHCRMGVRVRRRPEAGGEGPGAGRGPEDAGGRPEAGKAAAVAAVDLQFLRQELDRGEFDQAICAICLDALAGVETSDLECRHRYHAPCIRRWLLEHGSCPLCRMDVPLVLAEEDEARPEPYRRRLRFLLWRLQARHSERFELHSSSSRSQHYQRDHVVRPEYIWGLSTLSSEPVVLPPSPGYSQQVYAQLHQSVSGARTWAQSVQADSSGRSVGGGGGGGFHAGGGRSIGGGGGGGFGGGGAGGSW